MNEFRSDFTEVHSVQSTNTSTKEFKACRHFWYVKQKSNHRDIRHHYRWTLSTISTYLWGQNYDTFAKIQISKKFSLCINEEHFSNTQESLKILREIVIPYVNQQRQEKNYP